MTRVITGSRLHFGLFHVPVDGLTHWPDGTPVRKFGGIGMMLSEPEVAVRVERSERWEAVGPLAERALAFARRVSDSGVSFRVEVERCPPEHVGLGVGTQLGMAVGCAVATELGMPLNHREIAKRVGRGQRSGIGVQGFAEGGVLIDNGKLDMDEVAPEIHRLDRWLTNWRIVLARPRVTVGGCHGERERAAFARRRKPDAALRTTERLLELGKAFGFALGRREFSQVSEALHDFNRTAGEPFAADQGGTYASAEVDALVSQIRQLGIVGCGQSSWGPTVFAVCRDPDEAAFLAGKLRENADVTVATGKNDGATYSKT